MNSPRCLSPPFDTVYLLIWIILHLWLYHDFQGPPSIGAHNSLKPSFLPRPQDMTSGVCAVDALRWEAYPTAHPLMCTWEPGTWPRVSQGEDPGQVPDLLLSGTSACHHLGRGYSCPVSFHCPICPAALPAGTPVCPHGWREGKPGSEHRPQKQHVPVGRCASTPASLTPGEIRCAACPRQECLEGFHVKGLRTPPTPGF